MKQLDIQGIEQVIKDRKSIRDYLPSWSNQQQIDLIRNYCQYISDTPGPFGTKINIELLATNLNPEIKLGTYGVITGATHYLVVSAANENHNLFDIGYLFEKVVLYITSLNLGSVWMAGTYNRNQFTQLSNLSADHQIMIVCPFGEPAQSKSLISKIISKSNKRKPFEKLFFDPQLTPVNQMLCGDYIKVLEAVRLAPSSMNSQPWRMISDPNNGIYHFYSSINKSKSDVDLGIALCHFELMMNQQYIDGQVVIENNQLLANYKFSWQESRK